MGDFKSSNVRHIKSKSSSQKVQEFKQVIMSRQVKEFKIDFKSSSSVPTSYSAKTSQEFKIKYSMFKIVKDSNIKSKGSNISVRKRANNLVKV